jgi:hypothetical protein
MNGPIVGLPGVEISGGPRLLNFQKDSLGSNVDILPGSLLIIKISVLYKLFVRLNKVDGL